MKKHPSSTLAASPRPAATHLKRYFSPSCSTNPSTHGSGVGNATTKDEEVVKTQLGDTNTIGQEVVVPMPVDEAQGQDVDTNENDQGTITEFNPDHIISDPGLQIPIDQFGPNIRGEIRRDFMERGPTQPSSHIFPKGDDKRCFQREWFKKYDWLEYSLVNDKAYCFCCYLFRVGADDDKFGYEAFTKFNFKQRKNAYLALPKNVGGPNSAHNRARAAFDDFDNQRASVKQKIVVHTKDAKKKYETRVDTSLVIVSYIASQGVRQAFEAGCPKNAKMTSGAIQKERAECCAQAVTKVIREFMSGCLFSILVDESRDISFKEQMAIIVRYVNKKGQLVERFLGIKHVKLTTSEALNRAMMEVLSAHGLTIAKIQGQWYDGASNMRGEFNGVQKLIRDENPYAFYIHCFAHQLQLVVVSVSKCCSSMEDFFDYVNMIVSSTSASCKSKDLLLDNHHTIVLNKLEIGDISSGRGQHQEASLARPEDTRWGSHYKTLLRIETIFVFIMKMMLQILCITNELSCLLQKKDQNVVEPMSLVIDVKTRLVNLKNEGNEPLLEEAKIFCQDNDIPVPNIEDSAPRFGILEITCFACFDPRDSFYKFDVNKLARLTEIYLDDFDLDDRKRIRDQLGTFIIHVRRLEAFRVCHDLASLAMKMVELNRHAMFPLLRNKMSDGWLNNFKGIDLESMKKAFQKKKDRNMHLPKSPRRN
ncbi:hypothetical protein BS78_02G168100 [Paspalum vaginatum]|nr:hypothetical protein BS78_02G168100 [Paspalum vaginatum]